MSNTTFTIGKVARRAGIGVETIRFYEREKLIPPPARAASSGYRLYTESVLTRLRFIARSKELGFTLKETRELLELSVSKSATCGDMRSRAQIKLEDVQKKIRDLQKIEETLLALSQACPGSGDIGECPILSSLEGEANGY